MTLSQRFGNRRLYRLSDEKLLEMRMCDLPIRIEGTPLADRIDRLNGELEQKGLSFQPYFWLSSEWFTPDGIPGVAIPFYLAHPRLMELEEEMMLEVEGGTEDWCMKILRHETGHAIDNAYRLRRKQQWREVFGRASQPYPESYSPRPYSKSFVHHLGAWYAQAHPVEDFAETFAVWLKPRSGWRTAYEGWPALKKLECVDELMQEIAEMTPRVRSRARPEALRTIRKSLGDHYRERRAYYGIDQPNYFDRDLQRLFATPDATRNGRLASTFLRKIRPRLRREVSRWTGEHQYTVDQVLDDMIARCHELQLRVDRPADETERDALVVLTMHVMNYLNSGLHRIAL